MKQESNTRIGDRILALVTDCGSPRRRYKSAAEIGECMRRRDDPNP